MNQSEMYTRMKALPYPLFREIAQRLGVPPEIYTLTRHREEDFDLAFQSIGLEPWRMRELEQFLQQHAPPPAAPAAEEPPSPGQAAQEAVEKLRQAYPVSYAQGSLK